SLQNYILSSTAEEDETRRKSSRNSETERVEGIKTQKADGRMEKQQEEEDSHWPK
ncbi:unnamed protein product, partial [Tetraodon nigroviridis]